MSLAPALSYRISADPPAAKTRRLGYAGLGWALTYLPIHVFWALGGRTAWLGITESGADWRAANWGACVVIVGAGLTCLALTTRWGAVVPRGLLRGTAWVGGVAGITHWAVFSTLCALRLAGAVGYPHTSTYPVAAMRHYDWANLFYFEPWFGIMGILLIAGARVAIPRARGATSASQAPAPMRRLGTVLTVAGVAVVLWGVFTFDPRIFAGYGPALVAAGLLVLAIDRRRIPNNVHVPAGALPTPLGAVQPPIKPRG